MPAKSTNPIFPQKTIGLDQGIKTSMKIEGIILCHECHKHHFRTFELGASETGNCLPPASFMRRMHYQKTIVSDGKNPVKPKPGYFLRAPNQPMLLHGCFNICFHTNCYANGLGGRFRRFSRPKFGSKTETKILGEMWLI